ncbi:MAG TPA: DUF3375 domain-containing protein [Rectinemataceae bacterium]|nr:DUF3375 domain-containing protein [Rectinemataceae bacterium]
MDLDFNTVDGLRRNHPAWRLLLAEHAPLIVSFLNRVFVKPNVRGVEQSRLASLLEDELFRLRATRGEDAFPRGASEYLDDWSQDAKGWLRKYYPADSDEAHYDMTPGAEKAIAWIESLESRSFVGTESRLRIVFELLRGLVEGSGQDPAATIKELRRQKAELDRRITRLKAGEAESLDETAVRERFLHMAATAREILADFREVEQNFRELDRSTRESIAAWEGSKGELLEGILGRRDVIADSDQGRSFRAFWDFLMSADRQEALGAMLDTVFGLPAVLALKPEGKLRRVHFDWMEAGERTQRTVALLSRQLRRFLDDQVWMENRRIMGIIRSIEAKALELRDEPPAGSVTRLASASADVALVMERPLFSPPARPRVESSAIEAGDEDIDATALFDQWVVDREALRERIGRALEERDQVSLAELAETHPFERGLAELVAYLGIASEDRNAAFSETERDLLRWIDLGGTRRGADAPRVVFMKEGKKHAR